MRRLPRSVRYATAILLLASIVCALSAIPLVAGLLGGQESAIRSGRETIEEAREFDRLFPGSVHFISYYTGTLGPPTWNARAGLHGRYVLTMQMPITMNTFGRNRVVSHGEPKFLLVEVERVDQLSDGRSVIHYRGTHLTFGPAEWKRLVAANGDWGVLGVSVKKDEPVPGFDENWERG